MENRLQAEQQHQEQETYNYQNGSTSRKEVRGEGISAQGRDGMDLRSQGLQG